MKQKESFHLALVFVLLISTFTHARAYDNRGAFSKDTFKIETRHSIRIGYSMYDLFNAYQIAKNNAGSGFSLNALLGYSYRHSKNISFTGSLYGAHIFAYNLDLGQDAVYQRYNLVAGPEFIWYRYNSSREPEAYMYSGAQIGFGTYTTTNHYGGGITESSTDFNLAFSLNLFGARGHLLGPIGYWTEIGIGSQGWFKLGLDARF